MEPYIKLIKQLIYSIKGFVCLVGYFNLMCEERVRTHNHPLHFENQPSVTKLFYIGFEIDCSWV